MFTGTGLPTQASGAPERAACGTVQSRAPAPRSPLWPGAVGTETEAGPRTHQLLMTRRVGIEISSAAYRVVELGPAPQLGRGPVETCVAAFATLPLSSPEANAALTALRGQPADVVVWTRSDHRQVTVADGPYVRMRAEARAAACAEYGRAALRPGPVTLSDVDLETERTLWDIAPIRGRTVNGRRAVLLASAPAAEVAARLRPLVNARIKIRSVLTPAAALQSLARARRSAADPEALELYVALTEREMCAALMRDGTLLAARDRPWGFLDASDRDQLVARLAEELSAFAAACRPDGRPPEQVCICGGVPELRSISAALTERLDVEVEPLDSLFGIDLRRLPRQADEFRERIADLRLAWAVADREPAIDLFRARRAQAARVNLSLAVAAAGAAAGLAIGWQLEGRWQPVVTVPGRLARAAVPEARTRLRREELPRRLDVDPPPAARRAEPLPAARPARGSETSARGAPAAAGVQATEPFDAVLETILFGSERKLAIVDGHIVQPGDAVGGLRVTEITQTAVILRDVEGRVRSLLVGSRPR